MILILLGQRPKGGVGQRRAVKGGVGRAGRHGAVGRVGGVRLRAEFLGCAEISMGSLGRNKVKHYMLWQQQ